MTDFIVPFPFTNEVYQKEDVYFIRTLDKNDFQM